MRLSLVIIVSALSLAAEAAVPSGWKFFQELTIEQAGFVKLALPPETMNSLRADLGDLRIFAPEGETPFLIGTPGPVLSRTQPAKAITPSIDGNTTVLVIETGVNEPIESVSMDTAAETFIKPAKVEGSSDGKNWRVLLAGKPLYRLANGSAETSLRFPPSNERFLRVTIDDERSAPIPFTNVRLRTRTPETNPPLQLNVKITDRENLASESRIVVNPGAANVYLESLEIEAADPFYTRAVRVLVPKLQENEVVEEQVASGEISRIRLDEAVTSEKREVRVETVIPSQTLTLVLRNGDSPPLNIENVTARYRPFTAGFYAQKSGPYLVASGNSQVESPRYELNLIRDDVARLKISEAKLGLLKPNPEYRESETLPGIAETGAPIDLKAWKFRKQIQTTGPGIYQIVLDPETLSFAASGLQDLRMVQKQLQLPYILQKTGASAEFGPPWAATNDTRRPTVSLWQVTLPFESMPLTRLTAQVQNPLFQRAVLLYELGDGTRGDQEKHLLGQATWTRKPGDKEGVFSIELNAAVHSNRLLLETDNGDNSPISIQSLKVAYPITKVLFKAGADPSLHLYFGNNEARKPQYDLAIAGQQILKAEKRFGGLGPMERLQPEGVKFTSHGTGLIFWGVLIVVVVGLILVITRLLPTARNA